MSSATSPITDAAPPELAAWQRDVADAPAEQVVAWAVEAFRGQLALTCSFGNPGGMVLLDLLVRADPTVPILVLDTGLLFAQTQRTIAQAEKRYGITVQRVTPRRSLDEQAAEFGAELWKRQPDECCRMRKVEPLADALAGYGAWLTAVRRDSPSRLNTPIVAWDAKRQLIKLCPLAAWDDEKTWGYIRQHDLPFNPLLLDGYTSIGCETCTALPAGNDDKRSGRWAGFAKTECGLHR